PAEFHPAYYYSHTPEALTAARNIHRFLQFDAAQRRRLSDIFAALAAPVESCLGVPARVVNLKAWWTPALPSSVMPTVLSAGSKGRPASMLSSGIRALSIAGSPRDRRNGSSSN